jgi:hypothetical protein
LIKGTGGNGGAGPVEDVVGKRPPFALQPSSSNSQSQSRELLPPLFVALRCADVKSHLSAYPSPGGGNSNQGQPKDLASFLWQKGENFPPPLSRIYDSQAYGV